MKALKQMIMLQSKDIREQGGLLVELHGLFLPRREDPKPRNRFLRYLLSALIYVAFLKCPIMRKKKNPARPFIHARHICDGCKCRPIVGTRYHATNRENFDFCQTCYDDYDKSNDSLHLEFESIQWDRDVPFQPAWYLYRVFTGAEPVPEEWKIKKNKKKMDQPEEDDDTVGSEDDEGLSLMKESV